jgi:hypothetical protein
MDFSPNGLGRIYTIQRLSPIDVYLGLAAYGISKFRLRMQTFHKKRKANTRETNGYLVPATLFLISHIGYQKLHKNYPSFPNSFILPRQYQFYGKSSSGIPNECASFLRLVRRPTQHRHRACLLEARSTECTREQRNQCRLSRQEHRG